MAGIRQRWRAEDGATAIEYAIMASLIGVVIVLTVTSLGTAVDGLFQSFLDTFPFP